MRSEIRKYELHKAGECISNSSQKELEYHKLLDEIQDPLLTQKILRKTDEINERQNIILVFGLLSYLILGCITGFYIGYMYFLSI
jgi:hypothetical protein